MIRLESKRSAVSPLELIGLISMYLCHSLMTSRGAVWEALIQFGLQLFQASSFFSRTSIVTLEISRALCLNNSFSYLVSIRGVGEVPSFRLSKSIEGVAEAVLPSFLKCLPMDIPQFR